MATKATDEKNILEHKSISELQAIFAATQRLLIDKQQAIREDAVKKIQAISAEAGIKVFIKIPKKTDNTTPEKFYRNPDDHSQTWNGKGKTPKFITASGKDKSEFEVKADDAATA